MIYFHFHFDAMGSHCQLHLYCKNEEQADDLAHMVCNEIDRIEAKFSRYRLDSQLSLINQSSKIGQEILLDDETASLIDYAIACYNQSDGLFDISSGLLRQAWDFRSDRVPTQEHINCLLPSIGLDKIHWQDQTLSFLQLGLEFDLGGIGKEYAADRAADLCYNFGVDHGLIDLGGDLRILGPHPNGKPWEILIRNPRQPKQAIAQIELSSGALATSGDYERFIEVNGMRFCHILNPKTGWPVNEIRSISVHTNQCLLAGSLSTIAMLKGSLGFDWLKQRNLSFYGIDHNGIEFSTLNITKPNLNQGTGL